MTAAPTGARLRGGPVAVPGGATRRRPTPTPGLPQARLPWSGPGEEPRQYGGGFEKPRAWPNRSYVRHQHGRDAFHPRILGVQTMAFWVGGALHRRVSTRPLVVASSVDAARRLPRREPKREAMLSSEGGA